MLLLRLPQSLLHASVYFALFSKFLCCVSCVGFVQCSYFRSRSLLHAPVVYCTLLLLVIYVLYSLPHQHRACAVLFPSAPPLVFFALFSLLLLCVLCPTSSGLCNDFFPLLHSNLHAFALYILFGFKFGFYVLSLTNLIFLRFP